MKHFHTVCTCVSVRVAGVVGLGVQRCSDWFRQRWEECMRTIPIPFINHLLCVSMKFDFLCNVLKGQTSSRRVLLHGHVITEALLALMLCAQQ